MGHAYAKIKIYNPHDLSRSLDLELIVDTGSIYTWVRGGRLRDIELRPFSRRAFKTIRGELVKREIGEAIIECMGEKATRIVVFAEDQDAEVIGVETLEGLGLEVDLMARKLRRAEAILAL